MKSAYYRPAVIVFCGLLFLSFSCASFAATENHEMHWNCEFSYKIRSGQSDQIRSDWQNAALDWSNAHSDISIFSSSSSTNELYSLYDDATAEYGKYIARDYGSGSNRDRFGAFDAWINRYYSMQTYSWRSTACHEFGHVLGLGHELNEICIMNGNRNRNVIYSPQQDDIEGVIDIRGL